MRVRAENQHRERAKLAFHLVGDVGIGPRQVEIVKRLLLAANPEVRLVSRVEKQNCTQHGALSNALCTNQMHIPVQLHFPVTDSGAVYKYNFTELSHRRPPLH